MDKLLICLLVVIYAVCCFLLFFYMDLIESEIKISSYIINIHSTHIYIYIYYVNKNYYIGCN